MEDNDSCCSILSSHDGSNKLKMPKDPHRIIAFVDKHSTRCIDILKMQSYVVSIVTIVIYLMSWNDRFTKLNEENKSMWRFNGQLAFFIGFMIGLLCPSMPSSVDKWELKRHFADFGRSEISFSVTSAVSLMIFVIGTVKAGFTIWDIFLAIGLFFMLTIVVCKFMVDTQVGTKLRFKPCASNYKYTPISSVSKDKGSVRILESCVFKIKLQNIGSETWNSEKLILHRHTGTCHTGTCVRFNLPKFTLLPQEEINLIPDGVEEFEGHYLRISNLHCFGPSDRFPEVKTFITNRYIACFVNSESGNSSCECSQKKIAELLVSYNKNEWENVIVS